MQDYSANDWPAMAAANGLDSFESIWALDIGWFEEPNQRRGGWSGVSRMEVEYPDGHREGIFIKRQQNHNTFSWWSPFKGISTFRREFQNLMMLHDVGVPTLEVLYFAERGVADDRRAILVSRELTGYASLEDCMAYWQQHG
ncbi:MAG: lipopolysaccharide kinase InaA family protein, partial [Gammaproteobacteria bacterium]